MLFISEVVQKVEDMQRHGSAPSAQVMKFLSNTSLDHVIPSKPPITARRFMVRHMCLCFGSLSYSVNQFLQWSDASLVWLTSLIWGEIYVRGMSPLGIWNSTNVRLFMVKHTQNQQRQITETVTNVVGGFLRRTSDTALPRRS